MVATIIPVKQNVTTEAKDLIESLGSPQTP